MMEDLELRDNYLPNLPGLEKHCQIIDLLIFEKLGTLYRHFSEYGITVTMFATEWVFALFGSVVPLDSMGEFIDLYMAHGWPFFYKVVI
jgi:hypothetical protein